MKLTAIPAPPSAVAPWREHYRREMNCQIVHDSLHARPGWTESYLIYGGDRAIGYAVVAVDGPWRETRTLFEFFLEPALRHHHLSTAFAAAVAGTCAHALLWQTNDPLLHPVAQPLAHEVRPSRIVFADARETAHRCPGATFRQTTTADAPRMFPHRDEPVGDWVIELDGAIAATGGYLTHYNPPYADLYLEVASAFRQRGLGRYLLQQLKSEARRAGFVPCARCSPENVASLRTCQSAGFVPVAKILEADVPRAGTAPQ